MSSSDVHLSIVTICLNNLAGLKKTIESLQRQELGNFEHVVVDGGSLDGTKDFLESYESFATYPVTYISESDTGIYSAINKGITLSLGRVVSILNSGDEYLPFVLGKALAPFPNSDAQLVVYGNTVLIDEQACLVGATRLDKRSYQQLPRGMSVSHPGTFVSKSLYERFGYYDERFKISGDFEFLKRLYHERVKFVFVEETIASMADGGVSTQLRSAWRIAYEVSTLVYENEVWYMRKMIFFRYLVTHILSFYRKELNRLLRIIRKRKPHK